MKKFVDDAPKWDEFTCGRAKRNVFGFCGTKGNF
jgi:hypothetical protein